MLAYAMTETRSQYCYAETTACVKLDIREETLDLTLIREAEPGAEYAFDGAELDSSLEGMLFADIHTFHYTLEDLRKRSSFGDFSLFGLNASNRIIHSFDFSPYSPADRVLEMAAIKNCPIIVLFSDTESTLLEAVVIVLTQFDDRAVPVFCNLAPQLVFTKADKVRGGVLSVLRAFLPVVHLSGPASMPADSRAELTLTFESDPRRLDALCDFTVQAASGYLPRRIIRAAVGESVPVAVHSTGLRAGDSICVQCGFVQFDHMVDHTITITE